MGSSRWSGGTPTTESVGHEHLARFRPDALPYAWRWSSAAFISFKTESDGAGGTHVPRTGLLRPPDRAAFPH